MQPDNPYRLIEALGSSQVGTVWAAVDAEGRPLSVAVLDASVAMDQKWRDAFAAATNGLAQPQAGGPRVLYTDFATPSPWVACAGDGGPGAELIFLALGVTYQAVPPDRGDSPAVPAFPPDVEAAPDAHSTTTTPAPPDTDRFQPTDLVVGGPAERVNPWAGGPPRQVSSPPLPLPANAPWQQPISTPHATSTPPYPVSPQPYSTSGPPDSAFALPYYPTSGAPDPQSGPPYVPYPPSAAAGSPATRRRRRLLVGVAVVVALLVGATGGTVAGFALADHDGGSTGGNTASQSPTPPLPTPSQPGIEPPTGAAWPPAWPRFAPTEATREIFPLEGVHFSLAVPQSWACEPAASEPGLTHYRCGIGDDQQEIGGDIEIRGCPAPCDEGRWAEIRKSVDAWGLQWARSGNFLYWAATETIDGAPRYGLVFVLFWRSAQEKALDRSLVFRMSAPLQRADELRKVANSMRDSVSRWEF